MPGKWRILSVATILSIVMWGAFFADACPYCPPADTTLSEKLAESDAAYVVKFLSSKNGEELSMQTSTFEVVKKVSEKSRLDKGAKIVVKFGVSAEPGELFLLLGQLKEGNMEWNLPIVLDELWSVYTYLIKAPSLEAPRVVRLEYFLKFLDHDNPVISNDAFGEFARAEFNDVAQLSDKFSRTNIRKWLEDPRPQLDVRRAFYGMVLGLCGNEDDAKFLEKKLFAPIDPEKNRLGIEGMMGGFLLLRGQPGLQELVAKEIDALPEELPADDPRLVDLSALRMTLTFLWDYRRSQFTEDSLRAAMRRYLGRPEFADLVVVYLAQWKDWTSLDQLIAAYGHSPWETRSAKTQIVAFALTCQKDTAASSSKESQEYAMKAQRFLDNLDPTFVASVKRSLGVKISTP